MTGTTTALTEGSAGAICAGRRSTITRLRGRRLEDGLRERWGRQRMLRDGVAGMLVKPRRGWSDHRGRPGRLRCGRRGAGRGVRGDGIHGGPTEGGGTDGRDWRARTREPDRRVLQVMGACEW